MKVFVVVLAFVALCHGWKTYEGYVVLGVTPRTPEQLKYLQKELDVDFWDQPRKLNLEATFLVSPKMRSKMYPKLMGRGMQPKVVNDHVGEDMEEERKYIRVRKDDPSLFFDYDQYNELQLFFDEIDAWTRRCPTGFTCSVETIGQTVEGRDMRVFKITEDGAVGKKVMWIDSMIHCREWLSGATTMRVFNKMLTEYGTDEEATRMLNDYDYYFLPVMNPDGYVYTWDDANGDRLWRKNRSENDGSPCIGTDLNRNYGYNWGDTDGASPLPCSDTHHGPSRHSELETHAVVEYAEREFGDRISDLRAWITFHTYGYYWLTSYGDCTEPDDAADQLAVAAATCHAIQETNPPGSPTWDCGNSCQILYETSGTTQDWAKGTLGAQYGFTPELRGPGFRAPPSNIQPSFEEIWNGLVAMMREMAAIGPN